MLRTSVAAALAGVVVLVTAACGGDDGPDWAETSTVADGAPAATEPAPPGTVITGLPSPPLPVGDALRVVATKSRVLAQPVDADADADAHWSYERSGESVNGVRVARVPGRADPVVVTSWGDDGLVGLDGPTGKVLWHAVFTPGEGHGPLTASYRPDTVTGYLGGEGHLRVAGSVVLLQTTDELAAFDTASGAHLWQQVMPECNRSAAMGAHVVVDAGCSPNPVKIRVLDARTGEQTQELAPPPWPETGEGGADGLAFLGCREDGAGCALVEHHNGGGGGARSRFWTTGDDGRLVAVPKGKKQALAGDVQQKNGQDGIQVIDAPSGDGRWGHDGDLRRLDRPMFAVWSHDPLLPEDEVLWVSSFSWRGNIPVLAKLDAGTGRILGCQPPPTGKAATYLESFDERHVIIGSFFEEEIPADATFALVVPKPGTCPKRIKPKVAGIP